MLIVAAVAMAANGVPLGDEWVHYRQVQWFAAGHYGVVEELTTIPGFHLFVAAVQNVLHSDSLGAARGVTMAFAVAGSLAFASIRRKLAPAEDPALATLQFVFLPILFPFCFLLYTDVPSLALVLWAFRASLDRRHGLAGALGIASLLVRQTNVVWIAFIAALQIIEFWPLHRTWIARLRAVITLWPYALGGVIFVGYWLWRGSVSLSSSQANAHPDLSLHAGNLYFLLFLAGFLFLPLLGVWLPRYARAVRGRPTLLLLPLLLGILYVTGFAADHPYNLLSPDFVLRKIVLAAVSESRYAFVAFGAIAVVAGCALSQARWLRPGFALLLPVSMLFVSASWLIEQRYYLIPGALFLALRVAEDRRVECMMLALWIPVAVGILYGMLTYQFFL